LVLAQLIVREARLAERDNPGLWVTPVPCLLQVFCEVLNACPRRSRTRSKRRGRIAGRAAGGRGSRRMRKDRRRDIRRRRKDRGREGPEEEEASFLL
jgi:hypothetical protein